MTADIVMRVGPAVLAAHNNNGVVIDGDQEVVPGFLDFTGMSGEKPSIAPDAIKIGLVEGGIREERLTKGPAGPTGVEVRGDDFG